MATITLTPEIFESKPVHWMDDVGPVVIAGLFAFCCGYEADEDPIDVRVWVYQKPPSLPDDVKEIMPKTRLVAERSFGDENSVLHVRNFILKFVADKEYQKTFLLNS